MRLVGGVDEAAGDELIVFLVAKLLEVLAAVALNNEERAFSLELILVGAAL